MLTREEYLAKSRSEKLDNLKNNLNISPSDTFSNVNLGTSRNTWQRFIDTQKGVGTSLWEGMFGFADQIGDFVINISENAGWLDSTTAESARNEDWIATATKAINIGTDLLTGDVFSSDYWDDYHGSARAYINKSKEGSYLNDLFTPQGADIARQGMTAIGYLLPSILAGMATGGAATALGAGATGVSIATQAGALATTGIGAYAGGTNKAVEEGADFGEANIYGLLSGAVEVGTELAVGKVLAKLGVGTGKVAGALGAGTNKSGSIAKDLFKTMFEEGAEEFTSAMLDPLMQLTYKDKETALNAYGDTNFWYGNNDSVLTQTLMGGAIGGLLGGANIAHNVGTFGKDGYKVLTKHAEMADLTKDIMKEKNVNKKTQMVKELVALGNEQAKAVNQAMETTSYEQKENLSRLFANPSEYLQLEQRTNEKVFNEFLNVKANELQNIDSNQYLAKEFVKNFNNNFNSNYKIEFSNELENAGEIRAKDMTIVLNSKFKDKFVPLIAHELANHAVIDSLIGTSQYETLYNLIEEKGLTKSEIAEIRKEYAGLNEVAIKSEIIGRYFEKVFNNETYNALDSKVLNATFLNRIKNYFEKTNADKVILKQARILTNEIYKAVNQDYSKLSKKKDKGYKLNDDETTKYSKFRLDIEVDKKGAKDFANEKLGLVISQKNTTETAREIIKVFEFALDVKIKNKQKYYDDLYKSYNLIGKGNVEKFVNHILNTEIENGYKIKDVIKANNQTINKTRTTLIDAISKVMDSRAKPSQVSQLMRYVELLEHTLKITKLHTKQFLKLQGQTQKLKDNIKWNKVNTLTTDIKVNEANALKVLVSGIITTSDGHISGNWRKKFHDIDPRYYEQLGNSPFNTDNELDFALQVFEDLGNSYIEGMVRQAPLDTEEGASLIQAMASINNALKDYQGGVYEKIGEIATLNYNSQKATLNLKGASKISTVVHGVMNPLDVFDVMLGKSSTLNKEIFSPLVKAYDKQSLKMVTYFEELNEAVGGKKSDIRKRANEIVEFLGHKGVHRHTLYSLYLNLNTAENANKFEQGGAVFTLKNGQKANVNYSDVNLYDVKELLTAKEILELDNLKNVINRNEEDGVKNYLRTKQLELDGFTNVYEELDYFPLVASESKELTSIGNKKESGFNKDASSFKNVKSRTKAQIRIRLDNPLEVIENYIDNATKYGEFAKIERHNTRVLNKKIENNQSLWKVLNDNIPDFQAHYTSFMNKLNGIPLENVNKAGLITKAGSVIAKALLSYNLMTVVKQIGSLPTAVNLLDVRAALKGIGKANTFNILKSHDYLMKNNGVYARRIIERGAINADTSSNQVLAKAQRAYMQMYDKFIDFGMLGMMKADQLYVLLEFGLAQQQVKIETGFEIGTEENMTKASELLSEIILRTQSNSDAIATSMLRSREMGDLLFNLFGRFSSDTQARFSIIASQIIQRKQLPKRIKELKNLVEGAQEDSNEKQFYETELKNAELDLKMVTKGIPKAVGLLSISGAITVALGILASLLLGKKDKEEITAENFLVEFLEKSFIDSIPILSQIYNYSKYGGEVNIMAFDPFVDTFNTTINILKNGEMKQKDFKSLLFSLSKVLGIPTENIYNLTYAGMYQFDPELAIEQKSIFYGYSDTYLSTQFHKAKKENMHGLALKRLDTLMKRTRSGETSYEVRKELYRLDYLPKTQSDVNFDSAEYAKVNAIVENCINLKQYQSLEDIKKTKVLKKIYDSYHEAAGEETTTKFGQLVKSGYDITKMAIYYEQFIDIKADRLSTRKEKIVKKINQTQLNMNDKLLIAWLLGFKPAEKQENRLKSYLKGYGIKYE